MLRLFDTLFGARKWEFVQTHDCWALIHTRQRHFSPYLLKHHLAKSCLLSCMRLIYADGQCHCFAIVSACWRCWCDRLMCACTHGRSLNACQHVLLNTNDWSISSAGGFFTWLAMFQSVKRSFPLLSWCENAVERKRMVDSPSQNTTLRMKSWEKERLIICVPREATAGGHDQWWWYAARN